MAADCYYVARAEGEAEDLGACMAQEGFPGEGLGEIDPSVSEGAFLLIQGLGFLPGVLELLHILVEMVLLLL